MEHSEDFEVFTASDGTSSTVISLACATVQTHYRKTTGDFERTAATCSTGLRVYEGAKILSSLIAQFGIGLVGPISSTGRSNIIELGCGCGLAGFTAARFLQHKNLRVVFTDTSQECLRLVRCSGALQKFSFSESENDVLCNNNTISGCTFPLDWSLEGVAQLHRFLSRLSASDKQHIGLIVGSDIMYYRVDIFQLFSTIRKLLDFSDAQAGATSLGVLCHFMRIPNGRVQLCKSARELGLGVVKLNLSAFLESSFVLKQGWGGHEVILIFCRDKSSVSDVEFAKKILEGRIEWFQQQKNPVGVSHCRHLSMFVDEYGREDNCEIDDPLAVDL